MDHLLREIAPIPGGAWSQIDDEAKERLTPQLAARRIADFDGPGGWARAAISLGRSDPLAGPDGTDPAAVQTRKRRVLPLTEVRVPFAVDRREIEDAERGAPDLELDDLDRAARLAAEIENNAVFHGWAEAGITGILEASPHDALSLGTDAGRYPAVIAHAVEKLRLTGVSGPYSLVVGPDAYTRIIESTESGGFLLLDHLTRILGGPVVWAPGLTDAVVLSQRGDDFHLAVGQDLAIGYSHHDERNVYLYLEETFTFHVAEADAAIALTT
ncbi:MAG TPA: family 1 encapsulin nanocompartment shell protein [Pseudonocardia sp.]|jgi:uncharacterized linocin/CFP29 family protein